ncbi:MAG: MATE family efflux transporter [Oscillospiraceae bacterium]
MSGLILVVVGLLLAEPMLALMGTTPDLIDQAVLYMRIIFAGMPAIMVYDFGAGILRAVGDTRRPLLYLSLGGVVNVALNLFFVLAFDMGVAGVAIGTVVSQTLAAFLVVRCLVKTEASYGIRLRRLRIVKAKLIRILRIGIPTGVQGAVFSISNVLIQSAINSFDSSTIVGGNTASVNIENFVYTAMNAVYQGSLTFTSQNVGAHNVKRIVPIMWWSSLMRHRGGPAAGRHGGGVRTGAARHLLPDPQIIAYGFDRLKLIGLTYFLCGLMDTVCGCMRGLGASITPTLISLTGACALRIVWIYTIFASTHSLFMLYLSYPVSWLVTYIANLVCFAVTYRRWKCRALASTTIVNGYTVG